MYSDFLKFFFLLPNVNNWELPPFSFRMGSENLSKSYISIDWIKIRQEAFYLKMIHNQKVEYLKDKKKQGKINLSFRSMGVLSIKKVRETNLKYKNEK